MSQKTVEILERLKREPIVRTFTVNREAIDEEARTVELAFASDQPIDHWFGQLALSMDKKAMRANRLKSGAPLLMDHNTRDQVGVIESHTIGTDGVARATVRFGESVRASEIFHDVKTGIRQCVSVGFMVYEMHLEKEEKGKPDIYRSDDWEPFEVSIVAVPADLGVGVGRSMDQEPPRTLRYKLELDASSVEKVLEQAQQRANLPPGESTMTPEEIAAAAAAEQRNAGSPVVNPPAAQRSAVETAREIVDFAEIFGKGDLARQMIAASPDVTLDDVRVAIRAAQPATIVPPPMDPLTAAERGGAPRVEWARSIPRYAKLESFTGEGAAERAYRFGQFLMASVLGNTKAREFCTQNGIPVTRAMGESVNELGGYLVPDEFGNDLIDLREQYGVFRRNAKIVPMASDTRSDPRRTGGLTAYFVAEAGAITASDMGWDRVELVAKKLAVLARYSSEVNEDSVINFGDTLAGEIAYAFAEKEDRCGFIGDASSTYGGITGVSTKLLGLSATRADIAGVVVGSGNLFSELVIGDFEAVVAKLPQYADTDAAAWYVHRGFYWNVMVKAMLASGGVTAAEIEDARKQRFMGYRVEYTQVMPNVDANDQIVALLGDLAKAASMGIRRDTQIALSEHSRFANDQIEIRGTERFDINVHDVGNSSATAASRVPGPIVGLLSAAS